jgi:signal transduction histidine kinase
VIAFVPLMAAIALADRATGTRASLGLFYLLPMIMGAVVLVPWQTAVLALLCAALRAVFDLPTPPPLELLLRFVFAFLAYTGLGLFVTALIRNRQLVVEHLSDLRAEQALRREAEDQLKLLAESSPAAILTISGSGVVLAANRAANSLFSMPDGQLLLGRPIGPYLPVLADALRLEGGLSGFRTAAQSQGRRENGELFLAQSWFSSYPAPEGTRLAAIVVDSSEEMREREEQGLQQLITGNRIAAAAVSHEVRNLCSAISLICSNLKHKHEIAVDEDFQGLTNLVSGLEHVASMDLLHRGSEALDQVDLQEVLDDLRIVIEPDWREINGAVHWKLPSGMPWVLAERHGLFQAFLNLAKNSHRAVQDTPVRELSISVEIEEQMARVRFSDTGPGVEMPQRLFQPFLPGAEGSGLGLYISRTVVRSYGGDLRLEPRESGSCFTVEVQVA